MVSIKARNPVWVSVVDGKKVSQLNRTLVAGEAVDIAGVAPMAVVIGRIDSVDVQVHGKPFDLRAISKDNVARFEVK